MVHCFSKKTTAHTICILENQLKHNTYSTPRSSRGPTHPIFTWLPRVGCLVSNGN